MDPSITLNGDPESWGLCVRVSVFQDVSPYFIFSHLRFSLPIPSKVGFTGVHEGFLVLSAIKTEIISIPLAHSAHLNASCKIQQEVVEAVGIVCLPRSSLSLLLFLFPRLSFGRVDGPTTRTGVLKIQNTRFLRTWPDNRCHVRIQST